MTVKDSDTHTSSGHGHYPEGGFQAWSVVLGAWCAMVPSSGLLNGLGALQAWTKTHQLQEYSDSSIGWIYGVYGFFLFSGGVQFGAILDSHGPLCVLLPGSIGMVISLICLSFSQEYYQIFLSFSVLGGISASTLLTPPVAAVGHWFNARRGWATGVACTGGGVGGIIFPLIILFAAPRIGFAWAMRIIALISAALCCVACLTVKTRLPPRKEGFSFDMQALGDVRYATTCLGVFLVEFAVSIPTTYIASYSLHVGIDEKMSYAMIIFLNVGTALGRLIPGLIADKCGRFNVMVVKCFMCSLFTLVLWLCADQLARGDVGMLVSYALLFGLCCGAAVSLPPVCISQVCEIQDYGKRAGTSWTIASFGTLIGIPIAGAIRQCNHGEYNGLIIFAGVLFLASSLVFTVSRGICAGWSLRAIF